MICLIIEVAQFKIIITGWSEEKPKLFNDGFTASWILVQESIALWIQWCHDSIFYRFTSGLWNMKKVNFDFNVSHALLVSDVDRH